MSIEALVERLTVAVEANTAALEKLEAGRAAALAQLEKSGAAAEPAKPTRSRKKASEEPAAAEESAGNDAGDATAASPESPAASQSSAPTADEALLRQVATDYVGAAKDDADRQGRGKNLKAILDHFGVSKLVGPEGIQDAEQRAQAVFYLKRFGAGLEVNFSAEYDFAGDPAQGAESTAGDDYIG